MPAISVQNKNRRGRVKTSATHSPYNLDPNGWSFLFSWGSNALILSIYLSDPNPNLYKLSTDKLENILKVLSYDEPFENI